MDTISSAEFRKVYGKLTEPTLVTALGHPIGRWEPIRMGDGYHERHEFEERRLMDAGKSVVVAVRCWCGYELPVATERRLNAHPILAAMGLDEEGNPPGIRFNSQPFTGPITKPGTRRK